MPFHGFCQWLQIDAAQADLANAKTFEERARAERRLSELMAKRDRVLGEQETEKRKTKNLRPAV